MKTTLPHFVEDDFRLLFLDIDDVLNSVKTCMAYGTYPHPGIKDLGPGFKGRRFIPDDPPVENNHAFDQVNVRLVDKLLIATDTHVVLSSTWRLGFTVDECRSMLEYIGIDSDRVIGRTTSYGPADWTRGHEIAHFLEGLGNGWKGMGEMNLLAKELVGKQLIPKSYVILDDSGDMLDEQSPNFVHVKDTEGLSLNDVVKAGTILTKSSFDIGDLSK